MTLAELGSRAGVPKGYSRLIPWTPPAAPITLVMIGDPTPSEADVKVTRDMIRAGQLLKIGVLDHGIMGNLNEGRTKNYCSLREIGCFCS